MKLKTSELTGMQLDAAVHLAEGYTLRLHEYQCMEPVPPAWVVDYTPSPGCWCELSDLAASSDWAVGGPIIEREYIDIEYLPGECVWQAQAYLQDEYCTQYGPTPLVAAMRCFVASKLGDTAELPEELA